MLQFVQLNTQIQAICVWLTFHCRLDVARKSVGKLSPEFAYNKYPETVSYSETRVVMSRDVDTRSLQFSSTRCLVRLTFVFSITLTSANYDMHAKYLKWKSMLDFAEGLSLATSESTCVFDLPEG